MKDAPSIDPWQAIRALTPARIALARTGSAPVTAEVLKFGLAHARARDAVHQPLDVPRLEARLVAAGLPTLHVRSAAPDRRTYLLRPDLGRRLADDDREALRARPRESVDLCFVLADGLSPAAVQQHAPSVLEAFHAAAGRKRSWAPIVIAEQGRVALGDEIGELLGARLVVILIGERPGLSSPDSLGLYLTLGPRPGRTDAERNCISNVRPEGLPYAEAARQLAWLVEEAFGQGATGVRLEHRPAPPAADRPPLP